MSRWSYLTSFESCFYITELSAISAISANSANSANSADSANSKWWKVFFSSTVSALGRSSVGLNRLQIRPGCESALSEIYAFHALGLTPEDVGVTEDELQAISNGSTIPEIVTTRGISIEVKRIPPQAPGWTPANRTSRESSWQFSRTVSRGLLKTGDALISAVATHTGIRIRRHILVLVVPENTSPRMRQRIFARAQKIMRATETTLKTQLVLTTAPAEAFMDEV